MGEGDLSIITKRMFKVTHQNILTFHVRGE